jgi:hypothetical protein
MKGRSQTDIAAGMKTEKSCRQKDFLFRMFLPRGGADIL